MDITNEINELKKECEKIKALILDIRAHMNCTHEIYCGSINNVLEKFEFVVSSLEKINEMQTQDKESEKSSSAINLPADLADGTLIKVKDFPEDSWKYRFFCRFDEDGNVWCYYTNIGTNILHWNYAELVDFNDLQSFGNAEVSQ